MLVDGAAVQRQRWTFRPWTTARTSGGRLRLPSVVNHPLQPYDHQPAQIHKLQGTYHSETSGQYRFFIRSAKQEETVAAKLHKEDRRPRSRRRCEAAACSDTIAINASLEITLAATHLWRNTGSKTKVLTRSNGHFSRNSLPLTEPQEGGYAECDMENRRNQGQPSTKDITQKKNPPRAEHALTRRVKHSPGRQDSITRGAQRLQFADVPAAHSVPAVRAPPTAALGIKERFFAMRCAAWTRTHTLNIQKRGLMRHMSQKHGSQTLTQERRVCILWYHPIARRKALQSLLN